MQTRRRVGILLLLLALVAITAWTIVRARESSARAGKAEFLAEQALLASQVVVALADLLKLVDERHQSYAVKEQEEGRVTYERAVMDAWDEFLLLRRTTREVVQAATVETIDHHLRRHFMSLDASLRTPEARAQWRESPDHVRRTPLLDDAINDYSIMSRTLATAREQGLTAANGRSRFDTRLASLVTVLSLLAMVVLLLKQKPRHQWRN